MAVTHDDTVIVVFGKGWAIGSGLVLAVLSLIALGMAFASASVAGRLGFGLLGALMGFGAVKQALLIRSPLVLFSATREGITTYLDAPRYGRTGFRVPWSEVRAVDLVTRNVWPGNRRLVTIAIEIDPERSIPRAVSYGATADQRGILHLDAATGDLRGEALLEAFRHAWRRFGDSDGGTHILP